MVVTALNNAKPSLQPLQTEVCNKSDSYPDIKDSDSPTEKYSSSSSPRKVDEKRVPGSGVPIPNHFDHIIPHPEDVHHRNLVLCFDGTGDQFDSDVSRSTGS